VDESKIILNNNKIIILEDRIGQRLLSVMLYNKYEYNIYQSDENNKWYIETKIFKKRINN
jgi:hypothetical protein